MATRISSRPLKRKQMMVLVDLLQYCISDRIGAQWVMQPFCPLELSGCCSLFAQCKVFQTIMCRLFPDQCFFQLANVQFGTDAAFYFTDTPVIPDGELNLLDKPISAEMPELIQPKRKGWFFLTRFEPQKVLIDDLDFQGLQQLLHAKFSCLQPATSKIN